jgi:hypothetical protein
LSAKPGRSEKATRFNISKNRKFDAIPERAASEPVGCIPPEQIHYVGFAQMGLSGHTAKSRPDIALLSADALSS